MLEKFEWDGAKFSILSYCLGFEEFFEVQLRINSAIIGRDRFNSCSFSRLCPIIVE